MTIQTTEDLRQSPERTVWHGAWVWVNDVEADRNAYACFRRSFTLVASGHLDLAITADSQYWLYLDGQCIGHGPARAPLDYYLYDEHAIALEAGAHSLAVLVHHVGEQNACMMLGRPGLLVEATVTSDDAVQRLSTGDGWRCTPATAWRKELPCMMSHFGFWEDCDCTQLPAGWTQPAFDDHAWSAPVVVGTPPCTPWTRLLPRDIALPVFTAIAAQQVVAAGVWDEGKTDTAIPSEQVAARRRTRAQAPASLPYSCTLASAGAYLTIDFGHTISGYVEIDFARHPARMRLELSYDELLTPDGAVNPERSYAHTTDRYRLPGGAYRLRTTHPRGFRYVTLDLHGAGEVSITRVSAIDETYPFARQPTFTTQDDQLMSFIAKGALTVRACTTDAFTDCPSRERVQWMEDMYMHSRVALYTFGESRMLRHALFQAAQNALPDGRINGFFPSERINCAFASSSLAWLHLLVDYWLHTGNEDIHRLFPTAKRLLAMLAGVCDDEGLITHWPIGQFWDWAPTPDSGCLLLTNAAYLWALTRLAEQPVFAEVLGELPVRLPALRWAMHERFWDKEQQLYRDAAGPDAPCVYSQQANSLAVLAGICPEMGRVTLLERLIDPACLGPVSIGEATLASSKINPEQIVPAGTLWFAHFLVQALFEADLDDAALAQMRALWGAYAHLATFPETRIQHGNTGHCHGWASGPAYLLPAYVLGVQPMGPGWEAVRVAPHPGNLPAAQGVFQTPRGELSVSWTHTGHQLDVRIDAPEGIRIIR